MADASPSKRVTLSLAGIRDGVVGSAVLGLFVFPFGLAYGIAAGKMGVDEMTAILISGLNLAGAAQFAALDMWGPVIPLIPLVAVVFAVNSRLLLIGASLHPWLGTLPIHQKLLFAVFLNDASWATALKRWSDTTADVGFLLGSGVLVWIMWVAGTGTGAYFGNIIHAPQTFGLDMLLPCFFATVLVGMWKGGGMIVPWLVAAAATLLAMQLLPANWHVIVGALAGGLAGALIDGD